MSHTVGAWETLVLRVMEIVEVSEHKSPLLIPAAHYPHPKTSSEVKLKNNGTISLGGEISRHPNNAFIYGYF